MGTTIYKFDLKQLINFIESKKVAVPEFQRGFVWRKKQVEVLFDSLIKQYPIGSFIIWRTTQQIDARALNGEKKLPRLKYLILDGQQRMTSIYYLSRQIKFLESKARFQETCDNGERHLIDFEKFSISKNSLEYKREGNCDLKFRKLSKLIKKSYKFPVVVISLDDPHQAIKVFERINQAGTRISTESVFLSETWNNRSSIGKILRTRKKRKIGSLTSKIDTVIFIHVFAIVHQLADLKSPASRIEINIGALKNIAKKVSRDKKGKYKRIFEDSIESVGRAMTFLKEEYQIDDIRELPSQTMVTVLSIFFYFKRKSLTKSQQIELRKWYWRSSLSSRYIGLGYTENINGDVKAMKLLALENKKLNIPRAPLEIFKKIEGVDMRAGRSTHRNIFKQALWQQKPLFITGRPIERRDVETEQHKPEDDHFFPHYLQKKGIIGGEINNILNIHFLNRDENRAKTKKLPSKWLEESIKRDKPHQKAIEEYFKSELLPFKTLGDLKQYERAFKSKNAKVIQRIFLKSYKRFLRKRLELFKKALTRLQNGKQK